MKDNPNCGQWHPWGTCPDCREEDMSNSWNHAQCTLCWEMSHLNEPRMPIRVKWEAVKESEEEVYCCFCGDLITDDFLDEGGVIYVRADPASLSCADLHPQS